MDLAYAEKEREKKKEKGRKKKHFIGIKMEVKISRGNSTWIPVPVPCSTLHSALLRGPNHRAPLPRSCGGVMGCLYEIYRDVPAPSTDHGVGRDIWRAIFSAGAGGGG